MMIASAANRHMGRTARNGSELPVTCFEKAFVLVNAFDIYGVLPEALMVAGHALA